MHFVYLVCVNVYTYMFYHVIGLSCEHRKSQPCRRGSPLSQCPVIHRDTDWGVTYLTGWGKSHPKSQIGFIIYAMHFWYHLCFGFKKNLCFLLIDFSSLLIFLLSDFGCWKIRIVWCLPRCLTLHQSCRFSELLLHMSGGRIRLWQPQPAKHMEHRDAYFPSSNWTTAHIYGLLV